MTPARQDVLEGSNLTLPTGLPPDDFFEINALGTGRTPYSRLQ